MLFSALSGMKKAEKAIGNEKVTICHRAGSEKNPTVTITVSVNALPTHLAHGDSIG